MQAAAAEPLFAWRDVVLDYAGFLGSFALLGAAGFWLALARPYLPAAIDDAPMSRAARVAARIGLAGALITAIVTLVRLSGAAAEKGIAFGAAAAAGGRPLALAAVLLVVLVALFAPLASGRARGLWPLAAACVIALTLRNLVTGRWVTLVNPLHVLAGGLWIGTLAVLAITVIPLALRGELGPRAAGAPSLSELVARFSRLSLAAGALLLASGLTTAWRHLKYPAALWTTPYGYTLLAKLSVVVLVAAMGAYNWRRVSPALGDDGGVARLHRTSRAELAAATVVLAITALLVSLPAPRAPKPPAPASATPAAGSGAAH